MGSLRKSSPFVRCLAGSILAAILIFLTCFFLIPRDPSITLDSISLASNSTGGVIQITSLTGISAKMVLGLTIENNCYFAVTVNSLAFNATNTKYDNGHTPFASGNNVTSFTINARSNIRISYPFALQYDAGKDTGFQFLSYVGTRCAASAFLGLEGQGITADVVVDTQYNALAIAKGWIVRSMSASVTC
ncbi:hypothetical protein HDU98_002112 [Podochytrium sp. JEL0797]|nr:hypothetical protein HDU98_002112 [Podochytrium sp. JEL0797]